MTDTEIKSEKCEQFLETLNTAAWCKQGETVLVAVHQCTPEVLEVLKDHEAKVFPGSLIVKINRSTLATFHSHYDEGQPVPILLVWKPEFVEIWFRIHKSEAFPYDVWSDPKAAAYERQCVSISTVTLGPKAMEYYRQHIATAKRCPATIPAL